jgi:citrate lyase subunit beta/citryl-CoA lyase
MSHTLHPPRRARLQRSTLAVPASSEKMIVKAADSAADVVFLDLEDAVAPADKTRARAQAVMAVNQIDWAGKGKTVCVRINGLDTPYMYRDVIDLLEQAGERLDTLMLPKTGVPADVYMVDALARQIEQAVGLARRVGIEVLIETALGMANVEAIARFAALECDRVESLHFGVADYAASLRMRTVNIGGLNPAYPGDPQHSGLSRLVAAGRAYGLRVSDGPFGDIRDAEGFEAAARRAAALGCEGKMVIHPSQIAIANAVFSPPDTEVAQARRILEALETAAAEGRGAAALDGRMIDAANEKMARNVLAVDAAIRAKGG